MQLIYITGTFLDFLVGESMMLIKRIKYSSVFFLCTVFCSTAFGQFAESYEYAMIGYENEATQNRVYRLVQDLESGRQSLEWKDDRGYLESLLEAFEIDPSSQVLVFSPTSLQHKLINHETPRALYFSEDMYVGYVLNSEIVEITAVDDKFGMVFYVFNNKKDPDTFFDRNDQGCLVCHDSQGTMGGGTPSLMALSSVYSENGVPLKKYSGVGNVVDQFPISDRWGGWYVTGQHGKQKHLGNFRIKDPRELQNLENHLMGNLDTLDGLFDTSPYLRPTSDIVSLMILEHQLTVQNQITYVQFKAPAVLERKGMDDALDATSWDELPDSAQSTLSRMLNKLVDLMLMKDAAPFDDEMKGDPAYQQWFWLMVEKIAKVVHCGIWT